MLGWQFLLYQTSLAGYLVTPPSGGPREANPSLMKEEPTVMGRQPVSSLITEKETVGETAREDELVLSKLEELSLDLQSLKARSGSSYL